MVKYAGPVLGVEHRSGWVSLTRKHTVFTIPVTTLAHAGRKQNAMKRLIHAMAALGAALVFGCAGAPETPYDADEHTALAPSDDESEGSDIGQVEEAITDCQYMGVEVTPTGAVTANSCWSTFAHEPYYCGIPMVYSRTDSVKWAFGTNTSQAICASSMEPTGFGPMGDVTSITAGFNAWAAGSGLTFTQITDPSAADIVVGCSTPEAQAVGDDVWATTGPFGKKVDLGALSPLGQWGVVQKPAGATNPSSGVGLKQFRITLHDLTIARELDKCPGATTGTARQNNMHRFMAQLVAHEVGHALGFGDYSSLGIMSLRMGVCSAPSPVVVPAALAAAAGSMRLRWPLFPGGPNASPCSDVPVPLKGNGTAVSPTGNQNDQYGAMVRDMIQSGSWDPSSVSGNSLHGSTLPPSGGRLTPDVTDGITGTFMSLPPTDYGLPPTIGSKIAYTDNMTFGIQTGGAHLSCNWSSTTQQCTFPHSYVFDWCFASSLTDAQFKADFRTYTGLTALQGSWNIPPDYASGVFRFHNSCNDPNVNLVVDIGNCSGTNSSNIDGYVCLGMPSFTASESIINDSGFTAPGTYYNWQGQPGVNWMTLYVDAADISARVGTSTERTDLFKHAVHIGLLWARGIGSRTDVTDLMSSRAVLPYAKTKRSFTFTNESGSQLNVFAHVSPGEYCRGYYHSWPSSFIANYPKGTTYITNYCGAD